MNCGIEEPLRSSQQRRSGVLADPSSSHDTESRDGADSHRHAASADAPDEIIRRDNQTVMLLRVVFTMLLVFAAGATSMAVHRHISNAEKLEFASEYESLSSTLLSSLFLDMRNNFWIAHTISKSVTLAMKMTELPPTNFTIPFDLWASVTQEARIVSEALVVSWIPFLYTDEERVTFEEYARSSAGDSSNSISYPTCHACGGDPGMVVEDETVDVEIHGLQLKCGAVYWAGLSGEIPPIGCPLVQEAVSRGCSCIPSQGRPQENTTVDTAVEHTMKDGICTFQEEVHNGTLVNQEYGTTPYAPMFISSSSGLRRIPPLYNLFSDPIRAKALTNVMFHQNPAISEMRMRDTPYHQYTGNFIGEASADLYYPVVNDTFRSSAELRVVGAIGFEFLWERLISGAVPAKSDLVSLVLENTCGQAHTYSVDPTERRLQFQANEDVHDPKYSHMGRTSSYSDYKQLVRFESPDGDEGATDCLYRFRVYPTQSFENEYLTRKPVVYSCFAGSIFLATSLVFLLYDTAIRRRQSKVMKSALRTNDIVSSLFPDTVRGRLYERAAYAENGGFGMVNVSSDPRRTSRKKPTPPKGACIFDTEPIADLFPHTTIMFLDIAGFTAWSSERDPSQVFSLLENLYYAFDEAGRKMGIFKVETIGDCYVAATGLPNPRHDHAIGRYIRTRKRF
jgi:Adenylate and Guanylate cyclase catalytic domain